MRGSDSRFGRHVGRLENIRIPKQSARLNPCAVIQHHHVTDVDLCGERFGARNLAARFRLADTETRQLTVIQGV